MIINRLDRFRRIELITIEVDVDHIAQLLTRRTRGDNRLRHNRLNGRPEVQIESNAARNATVECEAVDVAKRKRTGAKDINQIQIVRKCLREANNHLTLRLSKRNVSRGDQLIITTDKSHRRVVDRIAANACQAITADQSSHNQSLRFFRSVNRIDHFSDSRQSSRIAVKLNADRRAADNHVRGRWRYEFTRSELDPHSCCTRCGTRRDKFCLKSCQTRVEIRRSPC